MANFFALVLILLYMVYQCVHSNDKPESKKVGSQDLFFQKDAAKRGIMKIVGNFFADETNNDKQILDSQLKAYSVVKEIEILLDDMYEKMEDIPQMTTLTVGLGELAELFGKIDDVYNTYLDYEAYNKSAEDPLLHQFVQETRSTYQGPKYYFNTIFSKVVPRNTDSFNEGVAYLNDATILSKISEHMQGYNRICNKDKSQQQIMQILHQSMSVALLKVYGILEFCYRKLGELGETNYENEKIALNAYVTEKYNMTTMKFQQFMHVASREVWRCDPTTHIEDVTYSQLYNVFQKFVIHDNDMHKKGRCTKQCGYFNGGEARRCKYDESYYDVETKYFEESICLNQRKCDGQLYDCEDYFSSHKELWICPSAENSTRRYEYMLHGSKSWVFFTTSVEKYYGREADKKDCERHVTYDFRTYAKSFRDLWRICEICLCTCVDWKNPNSERMINIRPAIADKNYVVTGARLVKVNRTMNIQIQQGEVLKGGEIDVNTVHWKEIAKARYVKELQAVSWKIKDVYLGMAEIPNDRVVVGLKFAYIQDPEKVMFALRTLSTPYDYKTGILESIPNDRNLTDECFDFPPALLDTPINETSRVSIENTDVPTKSKIPSVPQLETKQIVNFTTTDFERDLGQTLIPFFDIQEVTVKPLTPLAGIGFYHKNREGYGGFLGIKLLTYDHSLHLN